MNKQNSFGIEIGWMGVVPGQLEKIAKYALQMRRRLKQNCYFIFNGVQIDIGESDNINTLRSQFHQKFTEGKYDEGKHPL